MPRIYLTCPAYALADDAQETRAISETRALAEALGWEVALSPLIARRLPVGAWLALDERSADLARAFTHDAIIAARGGYGCLDLLPTVLNHRGTLPTLVGYSDVTVLHAAWRARGGPETAYGFLAGVPHGPRARLSTVDTLAGRGFHLDDGTDPGLLILNEGDADGVLIPACLSVLAGLVGTPLMPDLEGAILAIEDVDERPYRIDRYLNQMHLAGCLRGVRALVIGPLRSANPSGYGGPTAEAVCRSWCERLGVPGVAGIPFGHHADPLTLPWGRMTSLRAGERWHLDIVAR